MIDYHNQRDRYKYALNDKIGGYNIIQFQNILRKSNVKTIHDFIKELKKLQIPAGMTKAKRDAYLNYYKDVKPGEN